MTLCRATRSCSEEYALCPSCVGTQHCFCSLPVASSGFFAESFGQCYLGQIDISLMGWWIFTVNRERDHMGNSKENNCLLQDHFKIAFVSWNSLEGLRGTLAIWGRLHWPSRAESFNGGMVCKWLLYTSKATCGSAIYQQVTHILGCVLGRTRYNNTLKCFTGSGFSLRF